MQRFTMIWLPLAILLSGLSRLLIVFIAFRRFAPLLGVSRGLEAVVPLPTPGQMRRAFQIRKLVAVMGRNVPWLSNCFDQAIVARVFLGLYRVPYAVYFGLDRDRSSPKTGLIAHAWVAVGPCPVSGGISFADYTVVQCYVPRGWQALV